MIQATDSFLITASVEHTEYERTERRKALYRVLANNIIRQLRETGYVGHELLEFAGEVMQAIMDNGWDEQPIPPLAEPASRMVAPLKLETGESGRPLIRGERALLRAPIAADREYLASWQTDPLVRNSLIPPVLRYVTDHLSDSAPNVERADFIVCDPETGKPVGLVSLHDIDRRVQQAALGKMIGDPAYRGKGVAHEATKLILTYGFEILALHRIYLQTLGGSMKNIKLNERLGFRFEGVLEDAAISEGRRADVILMAMLRSEFELNAGL